MRELIFPRPLDSSRHIAGLVTVTLDNHETVRFAHVGHSYYVRDDTLNLWDRAYMICVSRGHLGYMRSPEVYRGTKTMKVHRNRVKDVHESSLPSATSLLTPALVQALQFDGPVPHFLVDRDGAVQAVELFWERLGCVPIQHSVTPQHGAGRWHGLFPSTMPCGR